MAVPKNRHTKSRRNRRRAHIKLRPAAVSFCEKCGVRKPPHILCEECGTYKGREVIDVLKKLTKNANKKREREASQANNS